MNQEIRQIILSIVINYLLGYYIAKPPHKKGAVFRLCLLANYITVYTPVSPLLTVSQLENVREFLLS